MELLPQWEWLLEQEAPDSVTIGAHEHDGCLWWTKVALSDLPNGLFREEVLRALESAPDDLERARAKAARRRA